MHLINKCSCLLLRLNWVMIQLGGGGGGNTIKELFKYTRQDTPEKYSAR